MRPAEPRHRAPGDAVACAVVTISDHPDEANDAAGALAKERLHGANHVVEFYRVVPNDAEKIRAVLVHLAGQVDVVLVAGGTGPARRDSTAAIAQTLIRLPLPGFGELFRMLWFEAVGPHAVLTGALAGVYGLPGDLETPATTLLFCCPGSPEAVALALDRLILPDLAPLVREAVR